MVDRDKLSQRETDALTKVESFGFSETDAEVIAESLLSRKSCSWINNDPVADGMLQNFNKFLVENNYELILRITPVSTRGKYIWEIKSTKKW